MGPRSACPVPIGPDHQGAPRPAALARAQLTSGRRMSQCAPEKEDNLLMMTSSPFSR